MATVLLEIGTEEMPAGYLEPALAQLAALAAARLAAERVTVDGIKTWGTPRRLALLLTGVAERQASDTREVRGPTVEEAFTEFGEPTAATIGFARSHGAQVSELRLVEAEGVEYLAAIFRDEGRPTLTLLPAVFTDLITGLTFPKTMRWGTSSARFARPIRWIAAMMDEQVVPFTLGEVTASSATRGHRFLAPGAVEIPTAADYPRVMDENQVLLAPETRRAVITEQLETIAAQDNAAVADDGSLLDETVYRVEYPTAVRCTFDPEFLSLPEEVLLQTLREEQKFFPLREITGRLLPAFIAVRNGDKAYLSAVRAGYEVVARAKLLDAQFFFEQDRQRPLADRLEDLREVVILERVGTLHDKARRLQALAGWMADELGLPAHERAMVARAALLCKADLVTAMVIEHQDLQGMMGCVYARLSGEPEPVAVAIAEHTRPRQGDGALPATLAGSIVALCDRLDTAAACFAVGLIPAGDEDPYALRAAARGVARLLMGGNLRLSLSRLIAGALDGLAIEPAAPRDEVQAALVAFFHRHVADALMTEGISGGLARAALAAAEDTPADALARARTLQAHSAELAVLQRVALRVAALGRGVEAAYDPSALTAPAEQVLAERLPALAPEAAARAARGDIEGLYALLADVTPQVERFLSANGTDDAARARARQGLAAQAAAQYRLLADFAKLDR